MIQEKSIIQETGAHLLVCFPEPVGLKVLSEFHFPDYIKKAYLLSSGHATVLVQRKEDIIEFNDHIVTTSKNLSGYSNHRVSLLLLEGKSEKPLEVKPEQPLNESINMNVNVIEKIEEKTLISPAPTESLILDENQHSVESLQKILMELQVTIYTNKLLHFKAVLDFQFNKDSKTSIEDLRSLRNTISEVKLQKTFYLRMLNSL
eukprot:TRINITY_DN1100_c0_g1_i4.p1 TRINITY_DN1100_c0_g1~~TRINITY_DN1100_c0_g1_i4.p1  ORF type:complete len:204 (-),score=30.18 TRINITY_DN1100_c0_g1_i4:248-859(-)